MPTFEVQGAGRRQPDRAAPADPRGGRRGDPARQAAAQLGRLDHRRELRRQPRPGHADHPLRSVGARRHRGQADPQGRRLREHQRAVRAAGRAADISAAPTARSRACASASCTRCGRRRARAAARAPSASASAATARPATCTPRNSCSARSTTSIRIARLARARERRSWRRPTRSTIGPMGFGGKTSLIGCKIGALNRLPASFFVSVAYDCWAFRRLGVHARRDERRDHQAGSIAIRRIRIIPMLPISARLRRAPAARSRCRRRSPRRHVRALKVGDVVLISGRDVHRPRRRARAPDEARAAGRSARLGALSLRTGGGEGGRRAGASPPPARRPASARSRIRPTSSSATACAR